jgi:hypothetical protein
MKQFTCCRLSTSNQPLQGATLLCIEFDDILVHGYLLASDGFGDYYSQGDPLSSSFSKHLCESTRPLIREASS